jgi:hypothetical protein
VASIAETVVRYFSFFTILTNIIVAVCFTMVLINGSSKWYRLILKPTTLTAIAVYITIVGVVYNLILRFLWAPQGLQRFVDELLHSAIPLLFIAFWLLYVPKNNLKWKHSFNWLLYPLFYTLFILLRGSLSEYYPYPFIDVTKLGYVQAFFYGVLLMFAFWFFSLLFIGIGKVISFRKTSIGIS